MNSIAKLPIIIKYLGLNSLDIFLKYKSNSFNLTLASFNLPLLINWLI